MGKYKNYTGIDFFRLIAAILIITIHTSPLASFSVTGDFILTRIVARVAVPFFFMTSGFFLISRYSRDNDKLKKFVNKTACIYYTETSVLVKRSMISRFKRFNILYVEMQIRFAQLILFV